MTGSTKRTLATILLMSSVLSGCVQSHGNSAIDRLRPTAAGHAAALAGEDMAAARKTGLALIEQLSALADW
jgi:hypothetical protein